MPREISDKKKQLIHRLYQSGLPVKNIAREAGVSHTTAWIYSAAKKGGFESCYDYQRSLARKRGFESLSKRREYSARERGFESHYEYLEDLAGKRQERLENRELGELIKSRLKELGRTQLWLAEQVGISKQLMSLYALGKVTPKKNVLEKLYSVLERGK